MWPTLLNLWRTVSSKGPQKSGPRRRPVIRPRLEVLEDRAVPASLDWSTYFHGNVYATTADGAGNVYVTGSADSSLPTTPGAFQTSGSGTFVAKLNAAGALVYATYLGNGPLSSGNGASGVSGSGIAVDSAGDACVTGLASSSFPTTANALSGAYQSTGPYGWEGFATVLNPTGSGLLYSTYLPGVTATSTSVGYGTPGGAIAVDAAGNAYLTGTAIAGLITTPGAFQPSFPGSAPGAAFFAEIDPNLSGSASLVYSSYLGGSASIQKGTGIAVDSNGNAYVTGWTRSSNFPTTAGAFQTTLTGSSNTFISKFNPSLSGSASLVYSTLLGGIGWNNGFTPQSDSINGGFGTGPGIAVDSAGDAYVVGGTSSTNFPTTPGAFQTAFGGRDANNVDGDAFVTKLNAAGSALVYSTYLGGNGADDATSIAVDSSGNATVTGWTNSTNFPTVNPLQPTKTQGAGAFGYLNLDTFVTTLNAAGSGLLFSTYLGGTGDDSGWGIAEDPSGNVYVNGTTNSTNFPTTPGALQTTPGSGFVSKINPAPSGSFSVTGFPSSTTAGVAGSITVTALDPSGNVLTGYTGTVHFTSSDPQAGLPADYTFTAADNGSHTFSVTLKTAGVESITASDGSNGLLGSETGITVNPAAASHFSISAPASVHHGTAFTLTVTALDPYGNVATGYTGTIKFTSTDSTATLPPNCTFTAANAGVQTFVNQTILRKRGTQTVTVTDTLFSSLTGSDSISVT